MPLEAPVVSPRHNGQKHVGPLEVFGDAQLDDAWFVTRGRGPAGEGLHQLAAIDGLGLGPGQQRGHSLNSANPFQAESRSFEQSNVDAATAGIIATVDKCQRRSHLQDAGVVNRGQADERRAVRCDGPAEYDGDAVLLQGSSDSAVEFDGWGSRNSLACYHLCEGMRSFRRMGQQCQHFERLL